jgi:hypothetical protein
MVTIKCTSCGHENNFDQPYPYHAGFANEGFLYNDEGNRTLVWSSFDPAYMAIVGKNHPWMLTGEQHSLFESALRQAPSGGSWKFMNPARCTKCTNIISDPITRTIHYLVYPNSIVTDLNPAEPCLKEYLSPAGT